MSTTGGVTFAALEGVTFVRTPDTQAGDAMANQLTAEEIRRLLKLEPNATCGYVR